MERWTFLVIADEAGKAHQLRLILRAGDDPSAYPASQVLLNGTKVPVDDVEKDFEAPEWKAIQIFTGGGGSEVLWEELKDELRAMA